MERSPIELEPLLPKLAFWLVPLALAAAVGLFVIDGNFVQDDVAAIQNNPIVIQNLPFYEAFRRDFWGAPINERLYVWRPLLPIVWKWIWLVAGGEVLPFRMISLLLHMTATFLLLLFGRKLAVNKSILWMTAVLFAVHAVHAEVLGGIVSQSDLLSFVLGAFAVWLALDACGIIRGALVGVILGLACLAKESAFAFSAALMVVPWIQTGRSRKERLCVAVPAFLITCGIVVFQSMLKRAAADPVNNIAYSASGILWLLHGLYTVGRATGLAFIPLGLSPTHDYAAVDLSLSSLIPYAIPGLMILIAGLAAFFFAVKSRSPAGIIGLCLFFIPVLLLSSLVVPVQAVLAERLLYPASVTSCAMMAVFLAWAIPSPSCRWVIFALLTSFLLVQSWSVQRMWRDNFTLSTYAVQTEPLSWRAHQNQAQSLLNASRADEALWEFMVMLYILQDLPESVDTAPLLKLQEMPLPQRLAEGPLLLDHDNPCRFLRLLFGFLNDSYPRWTDTLRPFYLPHYPDCFKHVKDTGNSASESGGQ